MSHLVLFLQWDFLRIFQPITVFENHKKCRIWILTISINFYPFRNDLSGNTVRPQASGFQKLAKIDPFGIFNELLSPQNINVELNETFSVIFKHRECMWYVLAKLLSSKLANDSAITKQMYLTLLDSRSAYKSRSPPAAEFLIFCVVVEIQSCSGFSESWRKEKMQKPKSEKRVGTSDKECRKCNKIHSKVQQSLWWRKYVI